MQHLGDQLSGYLDQQVDASARSAIEAHLVECGHCRDELEAVRRIRIRVRALPLVEPTAHSLELPAQVVPLRPARRRVLVGAAAVAALVVGVGLGVNGNQAVPLQLDPLVEQHVARASVDPGLNVMQVQAVANR